MTGLNGATILVTRPAHQADALCQLIEGAGGKALRFPTLAIVAVPDSGQVQNVLANLSQYQWLIFVSANAVNFALNANGGKIGQFHPLRIAAIGQATAKAITASGLHVSCVPKEGFDSAALLASPEFQEVAGVRFLIVRGEGGREELANVLCARGADVTYLDVYKRQMPTCDASGLQDLLPRQQVAVITITSGEALQNLLMMVAPQYRAYLTVIPIVVVSERLRQMASGLGFKQIVVAAQPADAAIFEAVTTCLTGK
jgi:uroporphyrinogen-III synthase